MNNNDELCKEFLRLIEIIRILRSPDGCSWDKKQTLDTMGKHINGEACEVIEALKSKDILHIKEELGDLLMTIVMTAQIADEKGTFDMHDVSHDICEKLIYRHPHIFGEKADNQINPDQVIELWNRVKAQEKAEKAKLSNKMLEANNLKSAIASAVKTQEIASSVGFDWPNASEAFNKIPEEVEEVKEALVSTNREHLEEEIGDLLFAILNVARLSKVDANKCLKQANEKFINRFKTVEEMAEKDGGFQGKTLEELDVYWNQAKSMESAVSK